MKTYTEKIKKRIGRSSAVILVYHKKELKNILTFLEKSSENYLWVRTAKSCIHADRKVYLAGVYNSQKYSNYTKENNCNVSNRYTRGAIKQIFFI